MANNAQTHSVDEQVSPVAAAPAPLGPGSRLPESVMNRMPPIEEADLTKPASLNAVQERSWEITHIHGELKNNEIRENTLLRREHAQSARTLAGWVIAFVCAVTWLVADGKLHLSDNVLMMLLGSFVTGAISLYGIVMLSLFPKQ